jgi:uncharacterized membrane protein YdjX (TVP38/TMEM64 family)
MTKKKIKHDYGLLILIAALILIWLLGRYIRIDFAYLQNSLSRFPLFISAAVFVILYVIVTFFIFFSKDLFWLAAAIIFGPYLSAILICISEFVNAGILFYLARFLGRNYVEDKLSERYKRLDEKLGKISIFWLFVFRAAPLIPYRFLDLAAGLTKIRFKKYITAVAFGSPIKIFWIQFILFSVGSSIYDDPQVLREFFLNNKGLLIFSFIYIILIVAAMIKLSLKE